MTCIAYIAVNLFNGKKYVGITRTSLMDRRRRHFGDARRGLRTKFARAIRKYGSSAFDFSVLAIFGSYEEGQAEEARLIAQLQPAYNITAGGGGSFGFRHSSEAIEKMRIAKLGKPGWSRGKKRPNIAESARQRLLANPLRYWLGKKRDPELIKKMIAAQGPMTAAQLEARKKNIIKAQQTIQKRIKCIDDGLIFESLTEAASYYGTHKSSICAVLNGRLKTTADRHFAYCEVV